jgi:hypothetical protein
MWSPLAVLKLECTIARSFIADYLTLAFLSSFRQGSDPASEVTIFQICPRAVEATLRMQQNLYCSASDTSINDSFFGGQLHKAKGDGPAGQSRPSSAMAKSTKGIAFGAYQPNAFRIPWLRFSVIFLSCKANTRVYDAKSGHGPHPPPPRRGGHT